MPQVLNLARSSMEFFKENAAIKRRMAQPPTDRVSVGQENVPATANGAQDTVKTAQGSKVAPRNSFVAFMKEDAEIKARMARGWSTDATVAKQEQASSSDDNESKPAKKEHSRSRVLKPLRNFGAFLGSRPQPYPIIC